MPWVLIGSLIALFLVPSLMPDNNGDELTYSQFIALVQAGDVETVEVQTGSGKITGTLENGEEFVSFGGGERGLSEDDERLLKEQGV